MKYSRFYPLLSLSLILAASLCDAQTSYTVSHSIPQSDPNIDIVSGNKVGLVAGGGPSSSHSITVRWELDMTCTSSSRSALPTSIAVSYSITDHGEGKVRLERTPPQGGYGHGYGRVGQANGDTGTIYRQAVVVESDASSDPQPRTASRFLNMLVDDWVDCGNGTYKYTLVLGTDDQNCFAVTNPLVQAAPNPKYPTLPPSAAPGDGASGQTWQIINVTDFSAVQGVGG